MSHVKRYAALKERCARLQDQIKAERKMRKEQVKRLRVRVDTLDIGRSDNALEIARMNARLDTQSGKSQGVQLTTGSVGWIIMAAIAAIGVLVAYFAAHIQK